MVFPDQDTLNGGKTQPSRGICEDKPSVVVPTIVNTSQYYVRKIPSDFHVGKKIPSPPIHKNLAASNQSKNICKYATLSNIMIPCDVCFFGVYSIV